MRQFRLLIFVGLLGRDCGGLTIGGGTQSFGDLPFAFVDGSQDGGVEESLEQPDQDQEVDDLSCDWMSAPPT